MVADVGPRSGMSDRRRRNASGRSVNSDSTAVPRQRRFRQSLGTAIHNQEGALTEIVARWRPIAPTPGQEVGLSRAEAWEVAGMDSLAQ